MGDFRFGSPWFLLVLIALLPLAVRLWSEKSGAALRFPSLALTGDGANLRGLLSRRLLAVLRVAGLTVLILALARPQTGKALTETSTEAVDVMLVLDTSGSMRALDFFIGKERVTRLDAVKSVVSEFVRARPNDRMGMVVFGQHAFTQCPQTLDHGIVLSFLDQIEIGMAGDATAIGDAIAVATKRLKNLKSKSRVMVLLTDGSSNAGIVSPQQAAEIARTFGIKIYTIGIGSRGKAPFLVEGFFGRQLVYQDVDMDETTLQNIAATTNGKYFRATDTDSLAKIYHEIDQMEKTEVKTKQYLEYTEHFENLLALGIALVVAEVALANTRLRKVP